MNFRTHRYAPVLVLLVLSLVAEVLFGATPISRLGALLPVTAIYGSVAVLIRELARRKGPGFGRIVLLGAAYAIVEEGLALQSMFNPDLFNASLVGGRMLGVNWVWSEWTVGYHVVWSISIPILLAELLFPARRAEDWQDWRGNCRRRLFHWRAGPGILLPSNHHPRFSDPASPGGWRYVAGNRAGGLSPRLARRTRQALVSRTSAKRPGPVARRSRYCSWLPVPGSVCSICPT